VIHFLVDLLRIKGIYIVSSITCSSSGGSEQTALGIYNIPGAACEEPPEDEQAMLETM
jgi:hypothetical protein